MYLKILITKKTNIYSLCDLNYHSLLLTRDFLFNLIKICSLILIYMTFRKKSDVKVRYLPPPPHNYVLKVGPQRILPVYVAVHV